MFQIYNFKIGRLKVTVLFYCSLYIIRIITELVREANILTDENKPRKLTGWKDSREIACVCWLQPQQRQLQLYFEIWTFAL